MFKTFMGVKKINNKITDVNFNKLADNLIAQQKAFEFMRDNTIKATTQKRGGIISYIQEHQKERLSCKSPSDIDDLIDYFTSDKNERNDLCSRHLWE